MVGESTLLHYFSLDCHRKAANKVGWHIICVGAILTALTTGGIFPLVNGGPICRVPHCEEGQPCHFGSHGSYRSRTNYLIGPADRARGRLFRERAVLRTRLYREFGCSGT